jgi:hypothetical protein
MKLEEKRESSKLHGNGNQVQWRRRRIKKTCEKSRKLVRDENQTNFRAIKINKVEGNLLESEGDACVDAGRKWQDRGFSVHQM